MLCLFLFHIDYTIYANHVLIKTTISKKRYSFFIDFIEEAVQKYDATIVLKTEEMECLEYAIAVFFCVDITQLTPSSNVRIVREVTLHGV